MDWSHWILGHEIPIRLGFFLGIFALVATWEQLSPRRLLTVSRAIRWSNNLGLVFLNSLVLRLLFPAAAAGVAALAHQRGWGLLNNYEIAFSMATVLSLVAVACILYLQHVMFHALPVLWRLHRVHHADPDYDVTTGARFHTLEIILSMLIKSATIVMLGPPVVAVVIFEVMLNATAMFNHGNVTLPRQADRLLRLLVVTPDMHRVHHSIEDDESNSNFGFNLPWWDRLFGTYRAQPRAGHQGMVTGLRAFREPGQVSWLPGMLMLPFRGKISAYAINHRRWR